MDRVGLRVPRKRGGWRLLRDGLGDLDGDGELLFATLREVERYARRIGAQVDAMRPSLEHEGYWEGYRVYPSLRYARERGHRKIRVPLEV